MPAALGGDDRAEAGYRSHSERSGLATGGISEMKSVQGVSCSDLVGLARHPRRVRAHVGCLGNRPPRLQLARSGQAYKLSGYARLAPARRAHVDSPRGGGHRRAWGITLAEGVMTLFLGGTPSIAAFTGPAATDFPILARVHGFLPVSTDNLWTPGRSPTLVGGQGPDARRLRATRSAKMGGTGVRLVSRGP